MHPSDARLCGYQPQRIHAGLSEPLLGPSENFEILGQDAAQRRRIVEAQETHLWTRMTNRIVLAT